jgi:hypothetical protein
MVFLGRIHLYSRTVRFHNSTISRIDDYLRFVRFLRFNYPWHRCILFCSRGDWFAFQIIDILIIIWHLIFSVELILPSIELEILGIFIYWFRSYTFILLWLWELSISLAFVDWHFGCFIHNS